MQAGAACGRQAASFILRDHPPHYYRFPLSSKMGKTKAEKPAKAEKPSKKSKAEPGAKGLVGDAAQLR